MDFEEYFREENLHLIFEEIKHEGEFIAGANNAFSLFTGKDIYDSKWGWQFPAGRYVIVVYQRHSLYQDGRQIFLNRSFDNSVGKCCRFRKLSYVLIQEKEEEYTIPSWGQRKLVSHIIQNEKNPLQAKIYDHLEDAEKAAMEYSKAEYRVGVLEWFADYDMY